MTPVSEQIAVALFTRLQGLQTSGLWEFTSPVVYRPRRYAQESPQHLQITLRQDNPVRNPNYDCPGNRNKVAWDLRFNIACHVMPSEQALDAVDTITNLMWAEVTRVVCADSDWHTFGGLAIESMWLDPEPMPEDGGSDGLILPLVVTYRHSENDPYTAG